MTPETAQSILDQAFAPWVNALHPKITAISESGTTMIIPITDDIMRIGGIVSGQALAALADTSMVFACFGYLDAPEPLGTVTLDTQFLRPATGDSIRAEAEVTRAGKSMIFTRVTLIAEPSGKPVAMATATFAR
ncbi:Thioesterase family protein [Sulfitobacter noctilucae]|uniref:PaaI family thioesterase n=1 Tax=Sulfitobacter noctilucae TaxID=1342302 RepID=UPI0004680F38|nr:PaaI family thioesterase [Sulfitobacter noctilucae]KIN61677.1 Thioesterase family protein [Sulfitobacter noctilucae]